MSPYEEGAKAREHGCEEPCPYACLNHGDREDRMDAEVSRRRWRAGFDGQRDPYPNGWA